MANDPREAVLESVCAPAGVVTVTEMSPDGSTLKTVTGGRRSSTDRASVVFLKERGAGHHRLYAVSYPLPDGASFLDVVGVVEDHAGWAVSGSAGGSGVGPYRNRPWVNLGGWWNGSVFCAGGRVIGQGAEQAEVVRLVFADGRTVEDTVDSGLVLFLVEHAIALPAEAQVFGASDDLLISHPAL